MKICWKQTKLEEESLHGDFRLELDANINANRLKSLHITEMLVVDIHKIFILYF